MELRTLLQEIMSKYPIGKSKESIENRFRGNKLAKTIRHDFKKCVNKNIEESLFLVKGSAGQGKWASIPWLGIFDKRITESAKQGFYVVYLFSEDMQKVYLSLGQGWTSFDENYNLKQAKKNIQIVSNYFQKELDKFAKWFELTKDINLIESQNNSARALAQGYEKGNIWAFEYKKDEFPKNDQLMEDLEKMLYIYDELRKKIKAGIQNKCVDDILTKTLINYSSPMIKNEKNNFIDHVERNIDKVVLDKVVIGERKSVPNEKLKKIKQEKSNTKPDYIANNINNAKLGLLGEKIVLAEEKRRLKSLSFKSDNVVHVSVNEGDNAGYDIRSKDEEGNDIYIEVKTTSGSKYTPFYISKNELDVSKKYKEKYILKRLYNVKKSAKSKFNYYELVGPLSNCGEINLDPINYEVNLK